MHKTMEEIPPEWKFVVFLSEDEVNDLLYGILMIVDD